MQLDDHATVVLQNGKAGYAVQEQVQVASCLTCFIVGLIITSDFRFFRLSGGLSVAIV